MAKDELLREMYDFSWGFDKMARRQGIMSETKGFGWYETEKSFLSE